MSSPLLPACGFFCGLDSIVNQRTLTFDGEKLNVRAKIGERPEVSVDSETGA
jgi:hypothetical protein